MISGQPPLDDQGWEALAAPLASRLFCAQAVLQEVISRACD
jgi:hypothetical protein